MLLDLGPRPDATEYFAQAKALNRDGRPSIQIGYEKLPSRGPFGYPALMLPWLKVLPDADAVLAPFRTNQTLGLLLLLAVFAFYAYLAMPLTGGFAVLLLATLPGFFTFCRSSMSEVSASFLSVLAFMFAYLGVKEERRWKIYLSAVLLGLSLNVRIQSLSFAPLLLAMALVPMRGMHWRWLLHCAYCPSFSYSLPPRACAKHDPVSFAVQDRLRLLGSVFQGAPSSLFTSLTMPSICGRNSLCSRSDFTLRIFLVPAHLSSRRFFSWFAWGYFLFASIASLSAPF